MAAKTQGGYSCNAKDGMLSKYRNFLLGWGVRYIKIDRSYIHNFEARDTANPSGSLVRGEITRCSMNTTFKGAAGAYVFDVVCKSGTTWYLRAESWEEMANWMIAIWPPAATELDRVRGGTSAAILNPTSVLPPPLAPTQHQAQVFEHEPPPKNPNMPQPPSSDDAGSSSTYQPPSYSDLFDKHDPAVNGKR